ncbi:uncharacterized protein EI97DRAFT_258261 [Westerdykella ornata]|uniref:Uncharacterized protein n=1 Tax=Westerdykella ornata TaxID=318751 RepID=A0A6A6J6X3_WESOR|nr:uncharacterized protein EI97DRAFT_258261 [Westerdykella ornata]KAF2271738.1 hypothetical protein EI97DRAFT_258261 [Westerdykella ornata]
MQDPFQYNIPQMAPSSKPPSPGPSHRKTFIYVLLSSLTAGLATLMFITEIVALNLLSVNTKSDLIILPRTGQFASVPPSRYDSDKDRIYLGVDIDRSTSNFIIAVSWISGTLAIVVAIAFRECGGRAYGEAKEGRERIWAGVRVGAALGNVITAAAGVVFVFLKQSGEGKRLKIVPTIFDGWHYARATRETWLCGLRDLDGFDRSFARIGCGFATAARWELVPLSALSIVLVVLCFLVMWRKT